MPASDAQSVQGRWTTAPGLTPAPLRAPCCSTGPATCRFASPWPGMPIHGKSTDCRVTKLHGAHVYQQRGWLVVVQAEQRVRPPVTVDVDQGGAVRLIGRSPDRDGKKCSSAGSPVGAAVDSPAKWPGAPKGTATPPSVAGLGRRFQAELYGMAGGAHPAKGQAVYRRRSWSEPGLRTARRHSHPARRPCAPPDGREPPPGSGRPSAVAAAVAPAARLHRQLLVASVGSRRNAAQRGPGPFLERAPGATSGGSKRRWPASTRPACPGAHRAARVRRGAAPQAACHDLELGGQHRAIGESEGDALLGGTGHAV